MPFQTSTMCLQICPKVPKSARIYALESKEAVLLLCSAFRRTRR